MAEGDLYITCDNNQLSITDLLTKLIVEDANGDPCFKTCEVGGSGEGRIYLRPDPTGQTTIYSTFDDGWKQANNADTYTPLASGVCMFLDPLKHFKTIPDNIFNHKFRWTGTTGGYWDPELVDYFDVDGISTTRALALPNDYVIDHHTGLGWKITDNGGNVTWQTSLTEISVLNFAGFTDWFLPNVKELHSIIDFSYINPLGQSYPSANIPFDLTSGGSKWSGTTYKAITDRAWFMGITGSNGFQTKTLLTRYMSMRYHFT